MTINEKINTTLTYREVTLIAVTLNLYQTRIKEKAENDPNDQEMIDAANRIANRLTDEIYSYPKNDFTNKIEP